MITTLTTLIPKGKLIQVMADTTVMEEHKLDDDEKATVRIQIEKVPGEKSGEGE